MGTSTIITIAIVVLLVVIFISAYNRLVALKNNRENAFADIDVQLKQRHDLIPQLLGAVKGYMNHEKEVLMKVTEARNAAISASTIDGKIQAENQLSSALSGLNIQVEAYPDLKANDSFLQLQEEIADIENKLSATRRYFNSATREFNTSVEKFPNNIVAGMFGFKTQEMFDLGEQQRQTLDKAPEINF